MPPDYTEQLKAIVTALNNPTTPEWLIAALSALLGMIAGIFAQPIQLAITDWNRRSRMRRVLYTDLGGHFMFIYSTLTDEHYSGETKLAWQQQQFDRRIAFSAEDYLKKQPDVFMQLSERRVVEELYLWLHHTVEKTKTGVSNPDMFCQLFAEYVTNGSLPEKRFRDYFGEGFTADLMAKVKVTRELIEATEKAVAEGRLNAVDGFPPEK